MSAMSEEGSRRRTDHTDTGRAFDHARRARQRRRLRRSGLRRSGRAVSTAPAVVLVAARSVALGFGLSAGAHAALHVRRQSMTELGLRLAFALGCGQTRP